MGLVVNLTNFLARDKIAIIPKKGIPMRHIRIFLFIALLVTQAVWAKTDKLSVILDWFPNPDHAPLIVAKQKGFFKAQGLDVNLIGPADPSDPPKWIATQKADIGLTYEPEFMEQVDHGLPLIRIGTLIDKPLDCIVALKSSGIRTLADLKGKRIGTGSSGLSSIMLRTALAKTGIKTHEVELINIKYNLTQALLSKNVDAVTGMMRNFEVPQIEMTGKKVITFFPEEHGIPNYSVLIFVAHTRHINDPRFPRFLAALKAAVEYIDANPKAAWKLFASAYPESNNPVNRQAWFNTLPYFAEDPATFDRTEWTQFAEFMFRNKMIKKVQPVSRYAVALPEIKPLQVSLNEPRVIPK